VSSAAARRVALVTGGGHGIGRAICRELADSGLAVVVGDLRPEWADECAELIRGRAGEAVAMKLDVTSPSSAELAIEKTLTRFGRIDVLVNNAGGNARPPVAFELLTEQDWAAVVDLNLTAHWRMARLACRALRAASAGRIVSIATASVHRGLPTGLAAYIAAKAGVIGLVRALARELGPAGVTVNAVAPGFVTTDTPKASVFGAEGRRRMQSEWLRDQALPHPVRVQDVASAVRYLVSEEAALVTGHVLTVDGGWGLPG